MAATTLEKARKSNSTSKIESLAGHLANTDQRFLFAPCSIGPWSLTVSTLTRIRVAFTESYREAPPYKCVTCGAQFELHRQIYPACDGYTLDHVDRDYWDERILRPKSYSLFTWVSEGAKRCIRDWMQWTEDGLEALCELLDPETINWEDPPEVNVWTGDRLLNFEMADPKERTVDNSHRY